MSDEREVEQLIKQAVERRVNEILESAAKERPRWRWKGLGHPFAALREGLTIGGIQRSWAWEWAKAAAALLVPGTIFGLIYSSLVGSWISVAIPALVISLSLVWR